MKTHTQQEAVAIKRKADIKLHLEIAEAILNDDVQAVLDTVIFEGATSIELEQARHIAEIAKNYSRYGLDTELVEAYLFEGSGEELEAITSWRQDQECAYDRITI